MNAGKPETRVCRYFFIVYFIMGTICEYQFVLRNRGAILRLKVLFIILPFLQFQATQQLHGEVLLIHFRYYWTIGFLYLKEVST